MFRTKKNLAVIHPDVTLGKKCRIGEFVIIGVPPEKTLTGKLFTRIGDEANIRSHTVIYAGTKIGNRFQSGHHALVREHNQIGDDVSIGSGTIVEHHIRIGNRVRIHSNAFIPEFTIIEDDAWIGPCVVLTNAKYPKSRKTKETLKGPVIKRGAIIAANVTILPGITIGEKALIGAGAVVLRDVPDGEVVAGNPAHSIGKIKEIAEYGEGFIRRKTNRSKH